MDKNLSSAMIKVDDLEMALKYVQGVPCVPADEKYAAYVQRAVRSRSFQMYSAARDQRFHLDFWSKGVYYGRGSCENLTDAAQAVHGWVMENLDMVGMQQRFSFFEPDELGLAHEAGRSVEYQWELLQRIWIECEQTAADPSLSPRPLIEAARKHPRLAQLFPYTSLIWLHFSRTTGFPFTTDCPYARAMGNGRFQVYAPLSAMAAGQATEDAVIGEGDLDEALALLAAHLPENCGPAVDGTANDLIEKA
jgi:hypothetical protein